MRDVLKTEELTIPEGVTVDIKSRLITVKGPRGTLTKNVRHIDMDIRLQKGKDNKGPGQKRRKRGIEDGDNGDEETAHDEKAADSSSESELDVFGSPKRGMSEPSPDTSPPTADEASAKPKPRPRPRPRARLSKAASPSDDADAPSQAVLSGTSSPVSSTRGPSQAPSDDDMSAIGTIRGSRRPVRLVISDDED